MNDNLWAWQQGNGGGGHIYDVVTKAVIEVVPRRVEDPSAYIEKVRRHNEALEAEAGIAAVTLTDAQLALLTDEEREAWRLWQEVTIGPWEAVPTVLRREDKKGAVWWRVNRANGAPVGALVHQETAEHIASNHNILPSLLARLADLRGALVDEAAMCCASCRDEARRMLLSGELPVNTLAGEG